jgi:hypothetical protein
MDVRRVRQNVLVTNLEKIAARDAHLTLARRSDCLLRDRDDCGGPARSTSPLRRGEFSASPRRPI